MSDFLNFDPQTTAETYAYYDIMAMQTRLQTQQKALAAQKSALSTLKTALTDFRSSMNALNKTNNGVLQTAAKASADGFANITTNSSAQKGSYSFFVEQLATGHQSMLTGMTNDEIAASTGTLSFSMGEETLEIDMANINSIEELAAAINDWEDNPGMTASIVRANGQVSLMINSEETGAENAIAIDTSAVSGVTMNEIGLTDAQDAIVWIGDKGNGLQVTQGSNTFSDLIAGVEIEFTKAHVDSDKPLTISVDSDSAATKEQVNAFIDAYNTLMTELNKLTASGSEDSARGSFAGDSAITSLKRQLNSMVREEFGGYNMTDFGITADRNGMLTLDSEQFNKMLESNPEGFNSFFNGDAGVIKSFDKLMDTYLNSTNGTLKMRQETIDRKESQLATREEQINRRYETAYNRYLKQFSQLQAVLSQMNSTMSMFTTDLLSS